MTSNSNSYTWPSGEASSTNATAGSDNVQHQFNVTENTATRSGPYQIRQYFPGPMTSYVSIFTQPGTYNVSINHSVPTMGTDWNPVMGNDGRRQSQSPPFHMTPYYTPPEHFSPQR